MPSGDASTDATATLDGTGAKAAEGTGAISGVGALTSTGAGTDTGTGGITGTTAATSSGAKAGTGSATITGTGALHTSIDNFADAPAVTGTSGEEVVNLAGATRELDEPANPLTDVGDLDAETVWFGYTPPSPGTLDLILDTADYRVDLFEGDSLATLILVEAGLSGYIVAEGVRYNLRFRPMATGTYGSLTCTREFAERVPEFTLTIPDDVLDQTPALLRVSVTNGTPDAEVTFTLQDWEAETETVVWVDTLDETGVLADAYIPIPALPADYYGLLVTTAYEDTEGEFSIDADPFAAGDPFTGPSPVPVLQAGVRRWIIQDPTGTLDDYTFGHNPAEMSSPHPARTITLETTTASDGQPLSFEGAARAVSWTFKGELFDEDTVRALAAYVTSDRRWYLIDHRNRAWTVTFENFDAAPVIKINQPWAHTYTMSCLIHAGPEQLS